jgi:hypothetical protein
MKATASLHDPAAPTPREITLEPMNGALGAFVHGIDLRRARAPREREWVQAA